MRGYEHNYFNPVGKSEVELDSIASSAVVNRCETPIGAIKALCELIAEFLKALVFRVLVCFQPGPIEHPCHHQFALYAGEEVFYSSNLTRSLGDYY